MERLTNRDETEIARRRLTEALEARVEWFCAERRGGARVPLRKGEWELFCAAHGGLFFTYWSDVGGARVCWRVVAWNRSDERVVLEVVRRMGAERATLELIPRAWARDAADTLAAARRGAGDQLAALVAATLAGATVERVGLSPGARRGQPGRYARILFRQGRQRIAVTGPVAALGPHETDAFLASSLIWFMRLQRGAREKTRARSMSFIVPPELTAVVAAHVSLLREELRRSLQLYEMDDARQTLTLSTVPALGEALAVATAPRFSLPVVTPLSTSAARIVALAPGAIDVVRARRGETLRFRGLAFARVRRVLNKEYVWFGLSPAPQRRLLDEDVWPQLVKLVRELDEHRCAEARNQHHAFYRSAPEAWLETLLRRDISQLDPGLIVAPLYAQFRTSRDARVGARPVDLLAIRRDGRLVVIELKVYEDAALPLQGADYWRRVEMHRRSGDIQRARLFGDAVIADKPPLVYLVAPLLRFHRALTTLARAITPAIELYRFDINEDWRAGVRVVRRQRLNASAS